MAGLTSDTLGETLTLLPQPKRYEPTAQAVQYIYAYYAMILFMIGTSSMKISDASGICRSAKFRGNAASLLQRRMLRAGSPSFRHLPLVIATLHPATVVSSVGEAIAQTARGARKRLYHFAVEAVLLYG